MSETLTLREQLTEVWEIGQFVTEIRWAVEFIAETEKNIKVIGDSTGHRAKVIEDKRTEIAHLKQRIKEFASAL